MFEESDFNHSEEVSQTRCRLAPSQSSPLGEKTPLPPSRELRRELYPYSHDSALPCSSTCLAPICTHE